MKLPGEIKKEALIAAFNLAVFAENNRNTREQAINAAVCQVRAEHNLSMLEQMRLRSWLKGELDHKAQPQKMDSKSTARKPSLLHQMFGSDGVAVVKELTDFARRARRLLNGKSVLALAATLVAVTGLFPPWLYTYHWQGTGSDKSAGYEFIFKPPAPEIDDDGFGVRLDVARLAVEWSCIAAATGAALLFVVRKENLETKGRRN